MKLHSVIISAAVGLLVLSISGSANAQQGKGEACRAAVQAKRPCMGTMPNTVNRTACLKSAMQRCKQGGPGAI